MKISRRSLLSAGAGAAAASLLPGAALAHGDEMDEPAGESPPEEPTSSERVRRYAMVIDLRACDGCAGLGVPPQCTQNCNWARFVPEGQQWIEVYEEHVSDHPDGGRAFLPAPCMHCENAPCVNVCPVGATFHTPEGVVLVDQERCIGCRLCMAACPYDRRFFNWGQPVQPEPAAGAPYNVETQTPAFEGTVMKCDFCMDRAAAGGIPTCVETCPRGAIYFGDLEEGIATNGKTMADMQLLLGQDGVQRYKEDLGTHPRVYYIPGHGENADASDGAVAPEAAAAMSPDPTSASDEGSAADEMHPTAFMKDQLEWPWAEIVAYQHSLTSGSGEEAVPDG